ncbi:MAG: hypothetical protein HWE16_05455 [Gammaproteobacteria bacterium]|nr:hypothetical protein [Gammaproteobacteria bacterium]
MDTEPFYLPRTLSNELKPFTELELLLEADYIVILAEPGAGKSELMKSLSRRLSVPVKSANAFSYYPTSDEGAPLLIDAFDELSRIDQSGIYKVLGNAAQLSPSKLIISSRSSEWEQSSSNAITQYFDQPPLVVRIKDFEESEQRQIFEHHVPEENFEHFKEEISRFDLEPLLPNPQFLKMFADAYIESGKQFKDKRTIFKRAVERLAKEANSSLPVQKPTLSTTQIIDLTSEVFAKLLLSGSEGVTTNNACESKTFPSLASLIESSLSSSQILSTRLFKLADNVGTHQPSHKIVAEYCAAQYLSQKIINTSEPLSLSKLMTVVAPNGVVRDELRGLVGWLASLGSKSMQEELICLDPYAVLANGDPSQLEASLKKLLIRQLLKVEEVDPYFRRADLWRRFSVVGLFTDDLVDEVKSILTSNTSGHLRGLMLELLAGAPILSKLRDELRAIALSIDEGENTRVAASLRLFENGQANDSSDLKALISEGSLVSMKVVGCIIEELGIDSFDLEFYVQFFKGCSKLYPSHKDLSKRVIGDRYFIRLLVRRFNRALLIPLLNELTTDLACKCGKKTYRCECLTGISKVVGMILDRYFEVHEGPYDATLIWQWLRHLKFRNSIGHEQCKSVQVLREDTQLRQAVLLEAFKELEDPDEIHDQHFSLRSLTSHSGLHFNLGDVIFLTDYAFNTDNIALWSTFYARHNYYQKNNEHDKDNLRKHMREQARSKPDFLKEWCRLEAQTKVSKDKYWKMDLKHNRAMKRYENEEQSRISENIQYINENRELVESGQHWGFLVQFSSLILNEPDKIKPEVGDENVIKKALMNCFDFIEPHVPNLEKLAQLQIESKYVQAETILFAACLVTLREKGSLETVKRSLLLALRTNLNMHYFGVDNDEKENLKQEVDRLLFPDQQSAELFLRCYLEPQIINPNCEQPDVGLLEYDEIFKPLASKLSIEWLKRYSTINIRALEALFDIVVKSQSNELNTIIAKHCVEFICCTPNSTGNEEIEKRRQFWLVRAWYFMKQPPSACWEWLKSKKDNLLILERISSRMGRGDYSHWPKLTPNRIEAILVSFFDKWPKVSLPSSWGTGSPKGETAYRFLTDLIWALDSDSPNESLPVVQRLILDSKFTDILSELKSIQASLKRKLALRDFSPPSAFEIVKMLDEDDIVTVEGLRNLIISELEGLQKAIDGGEFNTAQRFYEKGERVSENAATEVIAERLNLLLEPKGITITPEHQLKGLKRSDFTATKMINAKRTLLVTEVKGQWHKDLYSAASEQLHKRYSIHPDAESQGIFLVLWFGEQEKVAGKKNHSISNSEELKKQLEMSLPSELKGLIDIFVLDVSKKNKQ